MIIDSHHHLWKYDPIKYAWINDSMPVLKHDFLCDELTATVVPSDVSGVVTIQAQQTVVETKTLLDFAKTCPLIRGVVGWLPLAAEESELTLLANQFAGNAVLKGIRHVVQDEPDPHFLLAPAFNRGVRRLLDYGWVYDILIFAKQLPATIQFVDLHPQQPFVLDHIAKPTIAAGEFDRQWAANLKELARRPNVVCKFSGVATEVRDAQWSIDTVRPYWDATLESFGVERIMFGSDWPVCLLRTEYSRWIDCVKMLSSELSAAEQRQFWHDNAVKAYQL